jgi:hypothetical protein
MLDPIGAECGKLGIPVAIHVTDPEAFFHPVDSLAHLALHGIANLSGHGSAKVRFVDPRPINLCKH